MPIRPGGTGVALPDGSSTLSAETRRPIGSVDDMRWTGGRPPEDDGPTLFRVPPGVAGIRPETGDPDLGMVASGLLFLLHGALVWIAAPLGIVCWFVLWPFLPAGARSLPRLLGWVDWNLAFALIRGPIRPFAKGYVIRWIPLSAIASVTHRMSFSEFL